MSALPARRTNSAMTPTSLPVTVEHAGARCGGRLLAKHPNGGVVETGPGLAVGAIVRCRVGPEVAAGHEMVLEAVVLSDVSDGTERGPTSYLMRWNWAHCAAGPGVLSAGLVAVLGVSPHDLDPERLHTAGSNGHVYAIHDDAHLRLCSLSSDEKASDGATSDGPEKRVEQRVNVDLACRFAAGGTVGSGRIRDISRGGVFIMTGAELPDEGAEVAVLFPLPEGEFDLDVTLRGPVLWAIRDDAGGGGFGLRATAVEDGHAGQAFHSVLDRLIGRHNAGYTGPHAATLSAEDVDMTASI